MFNVNPSSKFFIVFSVNTLSPFCLTCVYISTTILFTPTHFPFILWFSKLLVTHNVHKILIYCIINIATWIEAARKEYFERNFAWHAISESKGDLTANIDNATVMFVRPTPDGKSKDRLGIMKTTYNLKVILLLVVIFLNHSRTFIKLFRVNLKSNRRSILTWPWGHFCQSKQSCRTVHGPQTWNIWHAMNMTEATHRIMP